MLSDIDMELYLDGFAFFFDVCALGLLQSVSVDFEGTISWSWLAAQFTASWTTPAPASVTRLFHVRLLRLGRLGMHLPRFREYFIARYGLGTSWLVTSSFSLFQSVKRVSRRVEQLS